MLLWIGWTLVFASAKNAIIDTLNRGSISWSDRLYFTGYAIFTLGIGDVAPRTGRWQFVTILATLTENHKAYPIFHYFHSARPDRSPIVEIVVLDEALTLLRFGVPKRERPNEITIRNARTSVEHYLETLHERFVEPADDSPPSPDLHSLHEAGIPTVSDDEFETALDELEARRRLLYGLVESDARE
nr:ion channel [Haloterrigena salifodinae]